MHRRVLCGFAALMIGCSGTTSADPAPPPAQAPEPPPAVREPTEHTFVHQERLTSGCGARCRYEQRASSEVALHLDPDGAVAAASEGAHLASFRSSAGDRVEVTRWIREWEGSWRRTRGGMRVHLNPKRQRCERETLEGVEETTCPELGLALLCQARNVIVERPPPPSTRRKAQRSGKPEDKPSLVHGLEMSWICEPEGRIPGETSLTPFPWVFGMEEPVLARDLGSAERPDRRYLQPPVIEQDLPPPRPPARPSVVPPPPEPSG